MRLRVAGWVAVSGMLAVGACSETFRFGPGDIVLVRVSPDSVQVQVGAATRLQALALDATDALVSGQEVTWTSSAPGIAAVGDTGDVTGVAPGSAVITARIGSLEGSATVSVDLAPAVAFSADTVTFTASAGQGDPPADSVEITNAGGFALTGLALGQVAYEDTTVAGWLAASLSSTGAPATLSLTVQAGGITVADTYVATLPVTSSAPGSSPRDLTVLLVMGAGPPAQVAVSDGDNQMATVGSAVATAPAVLVGDQFGNPAPGASVTFAVASGGGSVSGAMRIAGGQGIARVGSWTLGSTAGENRLSATVAGITPVTFTATGTPDVASQIAVSVGDNQSAIAGNPVGIPPAVLVTDQFGNGVAGVTVTFAVTDGGGSITGATPESDASGIAAVGSWTLGGSAGPNTLSATVTGLAGSPVTFTATGLTGTATDIALESGDAQSDTVAATLALPYEVKITDTNGNPVSDIPVAWTVTGGGGSITPSSNTNVNGIASAVRTLGTTAGPQTAAASVGGLNGSPVTFTATATAGAAVAVAEDAGGGQTATVNTPVPTDPSVLVTDQFGNPVPGHDVTFVVTGGNGAVDPATAVKTGPNGIAAVTSWTLGTAAGVNNNELTATAAGMGLAGNPVTFTASATAGAPAAIAVAAGDGQIGITGQALPTNPAAEVTDQFGNPVGNVTVSFTVTGGGGMVSGAMPKTSALGIATVGSWTVRASEPGDTQGRTANTLRASINAGAEFVDFSGFAVFSYAAHVHPIWGGSGGCTGCHGGISGLTLTPDAASSYTALVDVVPVCDGTLGADYRRVRSGGGVANTDDFSILMRMIDPGLALIGNCDVEMPGAGGLPTAVRDTIRAWIRNGAPNN